MPKTLQELSAWAHHTFPVSFSLLTTSSAKYTSTDWLVAPPPSPTYHMLELGTIADTDMEVCAYLRPDLTIGYLAYDFATGDHVPLSAGDMETKAKLQGMWDVLRGRSEAMCSAAMYLFLAKGVVGEFVESEHVSCGGLKEACKAVSVALQRAKAHPAPVEERAKQGGAKAASTEEVEKDVAGDSKASPAPASV